MNDILLQAAKGLISAQSEDDIFDVAVETLKKITRADECAFGSPENGKFVAQASISTGLISVPDKSPLFDRNGIIQHSFQISKPCVVDDLTDVRSASQETTATSSHQYRSLLCVPVEEQGILVAVSSQPAAFSEEDLATVEELASLVTVAFDHLGEAPSSSDHSDLLKEAAAILSHDVANPLSVAYAHLEMAREDSPDKEHFDKAFDALDRLDGLVTDTVKLLRTGERVSSTEPVDLHDVAKKSWSMVETPDATLEISGSTTIMADESSLCQIFENLYKNAIEHGGTPVIVRVGILEEGGFYVEDNGPGIPPDDRENVFDYGHTSSQDQTGLGLSIVKWIVDAHGWAITVVEGPDGGARFEIVNTETV